MMTLCIASDKRRPVLDIGDGIELFFSKYKTSIIKQILGLLYIFHMQMAGRETRRTLQTTLNTFNTF